MVSEQAGPELKRADARSEFMANARPTIYTHPDDGIPVWTMCLECEVVDVAVDEDGCCTGCGMDALRYGRYPDMSREDVDRALNYLAALAALRATGDGDD